MHLYGLLACLALISRAFVCVVVHITRKRYPFGAVVIHSGPLCVWGYGPAPFQLGIWIGPLCAFSYAPCATDEGEGSPCRTYHF